MFCAILFSSGRELCEAQEADEEQESEEEEEEDEWNPVVQGAEDPVEGAEHEEEEDEDRCTESAQPGAQRKVCVDVDRTSSRCM